MANSSRNDRLRRAQLAVASAILLVVVVCAEWGWPWPFQSRPARIDTLEHPSAWQYLFSDPTTLGFIRLAIAAASLFVVVSVFALAMAGRWMSGFRGLTVDEKASAEERISDLEERLRATQAELETEAAKRQEAEDWADDLLDELDATTVELDATRDRAREDEDSEGGEDASGDSQGAG